MATNKKQAVFDSSFYHLAAEITRAIDDNKLDGTSQQEQVEELLEAEKRFKESVLKYKQSAEIYKKFLQKICVQNKNILSARPYFRETAKNFSKKVTPAIKASDIALLQTFDINYQLIKFIRDRWLGPFPKKAEVLFQRVHVAREKLMQNNLPLAINRAKLFYRRVPRSHLTLMDFINISAMGLAAAVDKWVGAYSPVFRSVIIGRAVGNLIDCYSETSLHFYPSDKKILYKANSLRGRRGITDVAELADAVNTSFAEDKKEGKSVPKDKITASQLSALMNAASVVSADATVNDEGYGVYQYTADSSQSIEDSLIEKDIMEQTVVAAQGLSAMQKKVIKLKGVKI